jgi:hypothetical protein
MQRYSDCFGILCLYKETHILIKLNKQEDQKMNRVRNGQKFIMISLVVILVSLTLSAPVSAAASPSTGWLSLWYSRSGCAYTYTVQWAGVNSGKTLELWIEENDVRIPPTHFEKVNSKSGTITYTFPSLATSTTANSFHGWAQLLDAHGTPIPGTLDFSSIDVSYCTAP